MRLRPFILLVMLGRRRREDGRCAVPLAEPSRGQLTRAAALPSTSLSRCRGSACMSVRLPARGGTLERVWRLNSRTRKQMATGNVGKLRIQRTRRHERNLIVVPMPQARQMPKRPIAGDRDSWRGRCLGRPYEAWAEQESSNRNQAGKMSSEPNTRCHVAGSLEPRFRLNPKARGDVVLHVRRGDEMIFQLAPAAFNPRKSDCMQRCIVIQFPAAARCDERCGIQIHGAIRAVEGLARGCEDRALILSFGS